MSVYFNLLEECIRSSELHFQIKALDLITTEANNIFFPSTLRYLQEESCRVFWLLFGAEISGDRILPFTVVIDGLDNQSIFVLDLIYLYIYLL